MFEILVEADDKKKLTFWTLLRSIDISSTVQIAIEIKKLLKPAKTFVGLIEV